MKLSMWILEEWLSDYEPVATIIEGKQTIAGSRFFAEDESQDSSHVYISMTNDVFPDSSSHEVLLMHDNDVISLRKGSLEKVFNSIAKAFEYYNEWERKLDQAALAANPEQSIVDACSELLGPMFILDLRLNLIAYSKNYSVGEVNFIWDDYILYDNPTLKTIKRMQQGTVSKMLPYKHTLKVFQEPNAQPYSNGIMLSYLDDGSLIGQLIVSSKQKITERELQLTEQVGKALERVPNKTSSKSANSHSEGIFFNIVSGEYIDSYNLEKLMLLQGWSTGDSFDVFKSSDGPVETPYLETVRDKISALMPDSLVVVYTNSLVGLVRCRSHDTLLSKLFTASQETGLTFGTSNAFRKLESISHFIEQATIALTDIFREDRCVSEFHFCGLHAITHTHDEEFVKASLHPLVQALADCDSKKMSSYAKTFRHYLQTERSYQQTAEALFLHRNTVLYRVNKVLELYPVDLDSSYEREYILTSFRILD